jgi:protein TonB
MHSTHPLLEAAQPSGTARLAAALAASIALHATAALIIATAPPGSLSGQGDRTTAPLQARIAAPGASTSAAVPPPATRIDDARSAARPEKAALAPAAAPASGSPAAAQALGLGAETVYHLPSELDARPQLRTSVDPPYPRVAPPDGGYLVLQLLISETGAVEKVNVAVADPEGFFEQTAIEAFAAARFVPGMRGGVAVKSQTWIELKFHPLAPPGVAAADAEPAPR